MNTSKYIPFDCVSQNIIVCEDYREYPGLHGTGFFCYFPPYNDYIFYITAHHCIESLIKNDSGSCLQIPISKDTNRTVNFNCVLESKANDSEKEDFVVYVVDQNISETDHRTLFKRALKLKHDEDVSNLLDTAVASHQKLRTVGYPHHDHPNCLNKIDYDKNQIESQPRGFFGTVSHDNIYPGQYMLTETNWKEGDFNGFSGSPVIALLISHPDSEDVTCIPVGIILRGSNNIIRFLNINSATNLISSYLNIQISEGLLQEIPEIFPGQGAY